MSNLQNIIAENEKEFDENFGSKTGGNMPVGELTQEKIKSFIHSSHLRLIEGFREMVRDIQAKHYLDWGVKWELTDEQKGYRKCQLDILSELNEIK